MLRHCRSPELTNLSRVPSAFHAFLSGSVNPEGKEEEECVLAYTFENHNSGGSGLLFRTEQARPHQGPEKRQQSEASLSTGSIKPIGLFLLQRPGGVSWLAPR